MQIGSFLGNSRQFNQDVLQALMQLYELGGMSIAEVAAAASIGCLQHAVCCRPCVLCLVAAWQSTDCLIAG